MDEGGQTSVSPFQAHLLASRPHVSSLFYRLKMSTAMWIPQVMMSTVR